MRSVIAAILAWALAATAAAGGLEPAGDLAADGRDALAGGRVIVVLFSTGDCPYCREVRDAYLRPLAASPAEAQRVIVREVQVDGNRTARDFGGGAVSHAELARRHGVRLVPRVVFLGPAGERLADPLVGLGPRELYGGLLERRIEAALERLRALPARDRGALNRSPAL